VYKRQPVDQISPNPYQPRRDFSPEGIQQLADSIRKRGLLQPVVVRRKGDRYELVVGERRWRAAKLAGLDEIPAILKDFSDQELLILSLIENLQREDLNPIDEAEGYQRLITQFGLSEKEVAELVGKKRPTISNKLRLLKLPDTVKRYLRSGAITEGHARALLSLGPGFDLVKLCQRIKNEGLSVRSIERLRKRKTGKREPYSDLAERLSKHLGLKVMIRWRGRRGRIIIELYGEEDLDRIIDLFTRYGKNR